MNVVKISGKKLAGKTNALRLLSVALESQGKKTYWASECSTIRQIHSGVEHNQADAVFIDGVLEGGGMRRSMVTIDQLEALDVQATAYVVMQA